MPPKRVTRQASSAVASSAAASSEDQLGELARTPIAERVATLKRQRDELQLEEEEQALLAEIQSRRRRLNGPTPAPSVTLEQAASIQPLDSISQVSLAAPELREPDVEPSIDALPHRGPKPEQIPIYEGRGTREYQEFQSRLEIAFRLDPKAFNTQDQRIAYTLQYLGTTMRQLWLQWEKLEKRMGRAGVATWSRMMEFLLNHIQSPLLREITTLMSYMRATQRESQPVYEFAAYLAGLENEMDPPYHEKQLTMHLYSKLRPELRSAILNYNEFPQSRQEMVERAATLEDNLRRTSARTSIRTRGAGHHPRNRTSSSTTPRHSTSTNNTTPYHRRTTGTTNTRPGTKPGKCNYCGAPGHWEYECTKKYPATSVNRVAATKNSRV
jgi:hypothetical protein